jgi:hypothetical protein
MKPMLPTDLEIQYWLTGRGHEGVLSRASGYEHAEQREWNGILYTPDFFHNFPAELKTRRRNLAEEGKEPEVYDYYLKQLRGYCAVENKTHGWLHVWALVEKQEDGTTKPEIGCYEVDFTSDELQRERMRLLTTKDILGLAISTGIYVTLPPCPAWMCGKQSRTMIKKGFCFNCNKHYKTELGLKKHLASDKGKGHNSNPPQYETNYIKSCKWYDDCLSEGII